MVEKYVGKTTNEKNSDCDNKNEEQSATERIEFVIEGNWMVFYATPTLTFMAFTVVTNAHGPLPSQQHAVWQPQQEVARPNQLPTLVSCDWIAWTAGGKNINFYEKFPSQSERIVTSSYLLYTFFKHAIALMLWTCSIQSLRVTVPNENANYQPFD